MRRQKGKLAEKSLENYNSFIMKFQENRYIIFFMFFAANFFSGAVGKYQVQRKVQ